VRAFCDLADRVYKDLRLRPMRSSWRCAPKALRHRRDVGLAEASCATRRGRGGLATPEYGWEELPGEGAFYAPKLEWHLTDAIGRTWQVGTIQSDRVLPERLDASYVGEDGERHRPVMLHRAIFGSYERFIGILIEHYAGRFPLWLRPGAGGGGDDRVRRRRLCPRRWPKLRRAGIRAEADLRNEKINYKVREHSLAEGPAPAGGRQARGRGRHRRHPHLGEQRQKVDAAMFRRQTPPGLSSG
jgi:threonyl-tRNA synthetase